MTLSPSGRIRVNVTGARGSLGIDLQGSPVPGQFLVSAPGGGRRFTTASGTGADAGLRTDVAAAGGSALVGYRPLGTGAIDQSLQTKTRQRVTTADYTTLQQAIDTGAREVIVNTDVQVSSDVTLRSNQVLRFTSGKITVPANATIADAVLKRIGGGNVVVIDPVIDASATSGVPGIKLFGVDTSRVEGGRLTKANMLLESGDNVTSRRASVANTVIDLAGYLATGVYVSGIRGVKLRGLEVYNGKEGVGVYNGARALSVSDCRCYGHTQDGFVVINGQGITFTDCRGDNNGQSGFTTQRQTSGENARFIMWTACHADDNAADGFDIRGANSTPWGLETFFALSDCTANGNGGGNGGCGFFVVNAEGTSLKNCSAELNDKQGLSINQSAGVIASGFRSSSNGGTLPDDTNRSGVLVFASNGVQISDCVSKNSRGAVQNYGIAFTGNCQGCRVVGGDFSNNIKPGLFYADLGTAFEGSNASALGGNGVFFLRMSERGIYEEEGVGIPTHSRLKGSRFYRLDGGNGEAYISNGGGSWSLLKIS